MKKTAVIVLAAMILLIFCSIASAGGPTNPHRQDMVKTLQRLQQMKKEKPRKSSGESDQTEPAVDVILPDNMFSGETVTFTAAVSGIDTEGLEYWWAFQDVDRDPQGFYYYDDVKRSENTLTYTFYSTGNYFCWLEVYQDSVCVAWNNFSFSIDGSQTIEEKVNSIVSQCSASTTWQTALNLHDWLTHNCYYDESLCYYGPDIIFRGYGVCDSYSKAYSLLCAAAGIPVERAISSDHAWNTLKLDGEWYQVDVTWDDPGTYMPGTGSPVSGDEGYDFFCLNSNIMQSIDSHTIQSGSHARACVSLEANYYIYKNLWQNWGVEGYDDDGQWHIVPYSDLISENFNQGITTWYCSNAVNDWYHILDKVLMYAINRSGVTLENGGPAAVNAQYLGDDGYAFSMTGWNIPNAGTLSMPEALEMIDESTFENVAGSIVRLSAPCTEIASRAFADSDVRTVYIPDSVQTIAPDAFSGCDRLLFVTNNATAIEYASDRDYLVIAP